MFKEIKVYANFNERTGYGIHASRFFCALDALHHRSDIEAGPVHISLLDTVTASQANKFPPHPSILLNVWESTQQPADFISNLINYDQLWVPSEWQRACSIAQGIPEEFVKVVPEGVDPNVYKPDLTPRGGETFDFVHVGQWQPRKSTLEICQSFLKAFPDNPNVRLYLSADTLFPSDEYKSTEERLVAYGVSDPRIIPVHYEERDAYIRRLQSAHCFVTCARSEGWNLPLCEAMACGVPSITSDFGGSTEYAGDALIVRIRELRKPHGIYCNWDVPGQWGEPDYDHLVELMKDAYENYTTHKEKALNTSEMIRTKFSWEEAAKKAYAILEEMSNVPVMPEDLQPIVKPVPGVAPAEQEIKSFARQKGYEVTAMRKQKAVFIVDCHPTNEAKTATLIETINQIKSFGYPVMLCAHMALPANIIEMVDYYVYDKRDILSGDDRPIYWSRDTMGVVRYAKASTPCSALAAHMNIRNAVSLCIGKYDWIYEMSYDTEIDLGEWLDKVHASDKPLIGMRFENQPESFSGLIIASTTEIADKINLHIESWEEFKEIYKEDRFQSESEFYRRIVKVVGLENIEWLSMDVGNRFNQIDPVAWDNIKGDECSQDSFAFHFVQGPFLHITSGTKSEREYDVAYSTPEDGVVYSLKQKSGMWSRPTIKYFRNWTITASMDGEKKFEHTLDLKDKKVLISLGSKALGDTIAWMPYIEEFRKKHDCHVVCSGWWQEIFDYPEIEFIKPGTALDGMYASYEVGCFDDQLDKNPINWRSVPLQKVATDILGLDYVPLQAKLKFEKRKRGNGNPLKPYICFSECSTMRNKLWNREGAWQKVIDYLNSLGYDCISVSAEKTGLTGVVPHNSQSIQNTIADIAGADFYLGLNAGPSWVAIALGVPCVLITGVSEEWNDYPNPYRVAIDVGCKPCFNDASVPISRDWEWCHSGKNYACTREITEQMVFDMIDKIRKEMPHAIEEGNIERSGIGEYQGTDEIRERSEAGNSDCHV